jgi:hypothetical protein
VEFHIRDSVTDGRKGANVETGADWHCPREKALGRNVHHGVEGSFLLRAAGSFDCYPTLLL